MKNKNIIITGITGQDGAFLSKNFIEQALVLLAYIEIKKITSMIL